MKEQQVIRTSYARTAMAALFTLGLLLGAGGYWSIWAKVGGAVIASGTVGVSGKPKTIQHLDGGIVERILIEAGDPVALNQALVEIDDKTIAANLVIYRGRLRDLLVRKQRLLAELSDASELAPPSAELLKRHKIDSIALAVSQQSAMLQARRTSRDGEISQLKERVAQFNNQIAGVESLITSKKEQLAVFGKERKAIETLVKQSIAAKNQLLPYERSFADLNGQIAEHTAEIGRLRNSISEVEISKLQVSRVFREKVIAELDEVDAKIDELVQQLEATEQQLSRTIIRSPIDGIVHELSIFTIGGVIQPGQAIMQIVPQSEKLEIEVSVDTQSIDQVVLGRKAVVRFPAFSQRTTPELFGEVSRVSPISVVDEKTGFSFYRVVIALGDAELGKLGEKKLVPGMPVEAVIPTVERTVLDYLLKPLSDSLTRVFREE